MKFENIHFNPFFVSDNFSSYEIDGFVQYDVIEGYEMYMKSDECEFLELTSIQHQVTSQMITLLFENSAPAMLPLDNDLEIDVYVHHKILEI